MKCPDLIKEGEFFRFFFKKHFDFSVSGQRCIVFRFVVYVCMCINTAYVYIVDIYIFGHVKI